LSYPAGVISDHTDRRKLLIWLQVFLFAVVLLLFLFASLKWLNIQWLLFFTCLVGAGSALTTPVWQAITPEVVSKGRLSEAIALNGVNFNLARAIGPALGGLLLIAAGIRSIFLFNAISFLALVVGIYRWHNVRTSSQNLGFRKSALEGLRAVRRSKPFMHLLLRTIGFTAFVSIVFAFLPQLSKYQWHQNSNQYTLLWVSLGIGSLIGSYLYGIWNKIITAGRLVFYCCTTIAVCLFLLTLSTNFYWLNFVLIIIGIVWINATSMLNVLAQQYSPDAFRGRFLAVNVTVFQTSIGLSSMGWGFLAHYFPVLIVVKIAAVSMAVSAILISLAPLEEVKDEHKENSVACADPLLQYQLQK